MFDRIKAKEKSKTLLRTRSIADALGIWIIIAIMPMAVLVSIPVVTAIIFMLVGWIGLLSPTVGGVISAILVVLSVGMVAACISLMYQAGMNRAALRMNRGDKNVRVLDIILAGDRLGRYIAIMLWQVLFLFLWNLPSITAIIIAVVLAIRVGGSVASAFAVILLIIACIWSIYITLNKTCQYYYAYCVAEDNRELAALDCIRESSNLMVDHKWELFVTMLSFLGWDVIAATFIGNVFVSPYKYLTYTSIYEQLAETFKPINRKHLQWLQNGPIPNDDVPDDERVVEILSGEFAGAALPVKAGEDIIIGRDPKRANVVTSPANTSISGLHCRIRYDEQNGKYIVIDHSTNGTYLNNEKLMQENGTYAAKGSLVKLADGAMILRLS